MSTSLINFEIKCKKCGSKKTTISITMFDSCDIREIECDNCGKSEEWA